MQVLAVWIAAWIGLVFISIELNPHVWQHIGASMIRWARNWNITNVGRIIAKQEIAKDWQDTAEEDLPGLDMTIELDFLYLVEEYGAAYVENKMGKPSIVEEQY